MIRTLGRLLCTVLLATLCSSCYDTDAWPAIHGDARNSDTAPYPGFTSLQTLWSRDFPGAIAAAATIGSNGQVYITTTGDGTEGECHLYVVDLATGADLWCSNEVNRWVVGSSVLIDFDDNIYVGDDEAMHSFDPDGNLRWETPTVGAAISAQFTRQGRVLFVTHIGQIMVLQREKGQLRLPAYELLPGTTYTLGTGLQDCLFGGPACPSANTPSIEPDSGRFYLTLWPPGNTAAELRALQYDDVARSITPLWSNATLEEGTASSPVISEDGTRVYVNDNGGNLVALNAISGALIWDQPIGFAPAGSPSVTSSGRTVPAGSSDSHLLAVQDNGATGSIAWSKNAITNLGVSVQVDNDVLYAFVRQPGTFLGVDLISVNGSTGAEYDRVTLAPSPIATVGTSVAADGTVVAAGLNGVVTAFGPAPAATAATHFAPATTNSPGVAGVSEEEAACITSAMSESAGQDEHELRANSWSCLTGF